MKHILVVIFALVSIFGYGQRVMMFRNVTIPEPAKTNTEIINWNANQRGYNNLSEDEQNFLYWVNYSRTNPKQFFDSVLMPIVRVYPQLQGENLNSLKSDLYTISSLNLLGLSDTLNKTSQSHSKDITSHNSNPSHNSTNGSSFIDRFKQAGLRNCGSENISFSGGDGNVLFMLVMLYLDINVPDLGHRKTLLNPTYAVTGIGVSKYNNGNTFLVEDFACKQN